ncbi:hypothetical protein BSL78_04424 [Apostichopus japonicus]|uniref:DED domain-containing protein n=1 Tax=Stichopus japonicus TaxID=307972 RepID=A0A2G8LER8_STIJA|nr:hypothetical protein BSL78_04424 [Apostichopus japonicus]
MNMKQFADIIIQFCRKFKSSKLKDVKYLCHEKVRDRHVVENAKTVNVILDDMVSNGTLEISTIRLLAELLHRCGLRKTMREIFHGTGVSWQPDGASYFSSFRCFLHDVSRHITPEMVPLLKNYCSLQPLFTPWGNRTMLEPTEYDEIKDSLDLFSMLEEKDCIGPMNINLIKDFSPLIPKNKAIMDYIDKYERL